MTGRQEGPTAVIVLRIKYLIKMLLALLNQSINQSITYWFIKQLSDRNR